MSRYSTSASPGPSDPPKRNMGVAVSADAGATERRLWLLAALDVTVWQQRCALETSSVSEFSSALSTEALESTGPAAAMALLQEAEFESRPMTPRGSGAAERRVESTVALPPAGQSDTASHPASSLSLWCLASERGVLISHATGLSSQAQRMLKDVLLAASRIDPAAPARERFKARSLRFNWPPGEGTAALSEDASTERALRGFLSRQLKDTPNPFVLYTTPDIGKLLSGAQLDVAPARFVSIGGPDLLLGDGAAKRALWQTLNTL